MQGVKPFVSIALATYNGERFLAEQLESLVNQTYPKLEIIVSDDGSTDKTVSILERYAAIHPQIRIYQNTGKSGVTNNFQHAIRHCEGVFIALADQDDIWLPGKIEQLVNGIGTASLIYHDSLLIDEAGRSLQTTAVDKGYTGNDPVVFLLKNIVSGHACLFKRELLEEALPFPAAICHDWWLAAVAADNDGIKFLPEVLVHYRQHSENASDFLNKKSLNSSRTARELYLRDLSRFACFKSLKVNQLFFREWWLLNRSKTGKWLCPRLFFLCIQNRKSLFQLHNKSNFSVFLRSLGFLWGFKLKAVVDKKYRFEARQNEPGKRETLHKYPATQGTLQGVRS